MDKGVAVMVLFYICSFLGTLLIASLLKRQEMLRKELKYSTIAWLSSKILYLEAMKHKNNVSVEEVINYNIESVEECIEVLEQL